MRTRDEVLIARFMRNETFTLEEGEDLRDAVRGMADDLMVTERQRDEYHALWKQETLAKRELADRLRELESQQASSEPVAWASYHDGCDRPWTVDLVKREPWGVSAGTRIVPLYAHPSAAGGSEPVSTAYRLPATVQAIVDAAAAYEKKHGAWQDYRLSMRDDAFPVDKTERAIVVAYRKHAASEGASA